MRLALSMKTAIRTPVKMLLTFLLLGATSYMSFTGIAEYTITTREYERIVSYYKGVGAVEVEPMPDSYPEFDYYLYTDERVVDNPYGDHIDAHKYAGLRKSDIDAISAMPYVTLSSTRYMTAGIADELTRSEIIRNYYNYTHRFIAEAEFHRLNLGVIPDIGWVYHDADPNGIVMGFNYIMQKRFYIAFDNFVPLTTETSWIDDYRRNYASEDGRGVSFPYLTAFAYTGNTDFYDEYTEEFLKYNVFGNRGDGINAVYDGRHSAFVHTGHRDRVDAYNFDYLESLIPSERYLIIGRYDPLQLRSNPTLTDLSTIEWWPQIYPLSGLPDNYLELEEFHPLREMIEITDTDHHTLDVVYADDMSSIMRFAEGSMAMTDGRMLTRDDSDSGNSVCVLNNAFMLANNLSIGDTISLRLGDKLFEQNAALGAVASIRERYSDSLSDAIEFEIIGVYRDTDSIPQRSNDLFWAYSPNTVFIPVSFLQIEVPDSHIVKPGEFSFVVGDARDISAFLKEAEHLIEADLGLSLYFNDGGWSAIEE